MIKILKVNGNSMLPKFFSGDYVVTVSPFFRSLKKGDVVVARHTEFGEIIKRVKFNLKKDCYFLEGDNKGQSISSESLGVFLPSQIVGRVIWRFPKPVVRNR